LLNAPKSILGLSTTSDSLSGSYVLLYFGFSFCPDICPQELEKVAEVQACLLEKGISNVITVFVTVDPKRDSCAQLARYIKAFPGKFLALNASPESIKRISRMFRVYYNEGVAVDSDNYLIDHSIIHYLVGPSGEFIDFFGKHLTVDEMTSKIEGCIRS